MAGGMCVPAPAARASASHTESRFWVIPTLADMRCPAPASRPGMHHMKPYQPPAASSATPLLAGDGSARPSFMIKTGEQGSMLQGGMMYGANGNSGVNPLYGSAPSPLNSQMGMPAPAAHAMHSALYTAGTASPAAVPGNVTPPSPGAGGNVSEAEMLQQLMGEITRLKSELGVTPAPPRA